MSGLMSYDELRKIREDIKKIDKEIVELEKMGKEIENSNMFSFQKLPYKFRLGYIKKHRDDLAKKINYII